MAVTAHRLVTASIFQEKAIFTAQRIWANSPRSLSISIAYGQEPAPLTMWPQRSMKTYNSLTATKENPAAP
jgi:hypothetical protein